jgi:hypothetical protein
MVTLFAPVVMNAFADSGRPFNVPEVVIVIVLAASGDTAVRTATRAQPKNRTSFIP